MKYCSVVFKGQWDAYRPVEYSYMSKIDVSEGDVVVVQARDTVELAKVTRVSLLEDTKATKFIICRVDIEAGEKMLSRAILLKDKKRQLASRIAKVKREKEVESLVGDDAVAKKLLAEIKTLECS